MRKSKLFLQSLTHAALWPHDLLGSIPTSSEPPLLGLCGAHSKHQLGDIFKNVQWKNGAITPTRLTSQSFTDCSPAILNILDTKLIDFVHIVAHSWGAHLAVQLGHLYPDRIGCIVVLDTPVTSYVLHQNYHTGAQLKVAQRDPNLSAEDVTAIERKALPAEKLRVDEEDQGLNGIEQVDMGHILLMQNPMFIVRPEHGAWIDDGALQVHKDVFNVKQDIVIKGCSSHEALFSADYSVAVADVIRECLLQYDTQHDVESRIEKYRLLDIEKTKASRTKTDSAKPQQLVKAEAASAVKASDAKSPKPSKKAKAAKTAKQTPAEQ